MGLCIVDLVTLQSGLGTARSSLLPGRRGNHFISTFQQVLQFPLLIQVTLWLLGSALEACVFIAVESVCLLSEEHSHVTNTNQLPSDLSGPCKHLPRASLILCKWKCELVQSICTYRRETGKGLPDRVHLDAAVTALGWSRRAQVPRRNSSWERSYAQQ